MDPLLKTQKLPKYSQDEKDKLNYPISNNEIEFVIKYLLKSKYGGPVTGIIYQTFKRRLTTILGDTSNKCSIKLIPKPSRDSRKIF